MPAQRAIELPVPRQYLANLVQHRAGVQENDQPPFDSSVRRQLRLGLADLFQPPRRQMPDEESQPLRATPRAICCNRSKLRHGFAGDRKVIGNDGRINGREMHTAMHQAFVEDEGPARFYAAALASPGIATVTFSPCRLVFA